METHYRLILIQTLDCFHWTSKTRVYTTMILAFYLSKIYRHLLTFSMLRPRLNDNVFISYQKVGFISNWPSVYATLDWPPVYMRTHQSSMFHTVIAFSNENALKVAWREFNIAQTVESGNNSKHNLITNSMSLSFIWSAASNAQWLQRGNSQTIAVRSEAFSSNPEANLIWNENRIV